MVDMDTLTEKVKAVNAAHKLANELAPKLHEIFSPLVGQKILKVDGTLFAKYKELLPPFLNTTTIRCWKETSGYSLYWKIMASSYEMSLYVGDLNNGVLTRMYDLTSYRDDFTVEEIQTKRENVRQLKRAFEKAASDLSPFGEWLG